MRKIIASDGAVITTAEFDDLSYDDQEDWCIDHNCHLAWADLSKLSRGIPGVYLAIKRSGVAVIDEADAEDN